jgi:hypothetical protein
MEKAKKDHNFLTFFVYSIRKYNDKIRKKPNNGSVITAKE